MFIQRGKRPRIANTEEEQPALKKKNRVKGQTQLNFKTCCKATLINTEQTNRSVECNREPRNRPTYIWGLYTKLIFDKGAKTIQWRKDSIFNKRV